jgi:hypothetical protein
VTAVTDAAAGAAATGAAATTGVGDGSPLAKP